MSHALVNDCAVKFYKWDDAEGKHTSGVRLGTPAATTRGLKEEDFAVIAHLLRLCVEDDFEEKIDYIRGEVAKICAKYPLYSK